MSDILWVFPPALGTPSASSFCTKLETWMRLNDIPYTRRYPSGPPPSKTGKLPALQREDGSILPDSEVIATTLAAERGIDPYEGIAEADRPLALLTRRALEEDLYWGLVHDRWAKPEGWAFYRDAFFPKMGVPLKWIVPRVARRGALAGLHGHGLGRLDDAARDQRMVEDVDALAAILGDRPYFLSDVPTLLDASAFGVFAGILAHPFDTALVRAVKAHDNLVAHTARIRAQAFGED